MRLLKTILVAVDFDDVSSQVLAEASLLAKRFGSEVMLIHVVEAAEHAAYNAEVLGGAITARLEEMRTELMESGVVVPPVLQPCGKAVVEIAAAAERVDANLIMLGAQGVPSDHHFPLGTTTEKIIRKSAKPVLAVHPKRPLQFANILCPVDFSDTSARGLANAIRLALAFHGKLHVLTVMPPPTKYHRLDQYWSQWAVAAEAAAAGQCTRDFQEFLGRFDFHGVDWQKSIARGDPALEIVAAADSWNADLIVMGSVGRSGLPYMLMGSTAIKVARQLPCALLAVKHEHVLSARLEQDIAGINAASAVAIAED